MKPVVTEAVGSEMEPNAGTAVQPADPLPFHEDPLWWKALVLAFVIGPLLLTGYAIAQFWGSSVGWFDVALLVGSWIVTGMGISVGYHRMLTHRAFETSAPVRAVVLASGAMALQGAPADWAATHIRHHAKADREGDPHSPLEGLWHSHFGWLVRDRFVRSGPIYEGLMKDPVVRFVSRTYILFATGGFIIPFLIGLAVTGTWGGAFQALLWGGFVRVFLGHHVTWSVNSIAHTIGTRPFETVDRAKNNVIVALLGFGEGWHNNHHAFPRAAFIGLRWWQLDPGRWAIWTMEKLGLVWNVWMPSADEVARRRARSA